MRRAVLVSLLALLLAGCATATPAPEPRELAFAAAPEAVLQETLGVLADEGYVIRRADAERGRAEAALARWPGYRVDVTVVPEGQGARASLSATRGGRPLPPHLLDPLLAELQRRLGLAP
ncbi:hypothetical protein HOP61_15575 [Halomonas daqingensis]|uniref:Lipoprotein n=1 Tax=Billgrantia desiderata TaxID=52021 RepID=A0AAW4YYJ8_9GAMM|nr:hypothetical protein [Halomonas desiderata]MCE8052713.1 hypothetical protein [Halomonas desiderata]